ncbi:hypothetical protein KFE96_00085 [Kordiimonas sp. SCSIO 12603]|uniref:hypothetical protein n=1 Tax=Kordiimonas sp. SCSIO 12603 TaxID=2829596 RepID=UPI002103D39F|nr:hypothetical protein [Kordiimonas sp. SCSIO 12603]UTW58741.1 hypothetical protein KFE96_00085 [Kordiimonas sp. SCSIO 12603]
MTGATTSRHIWNTADFEQMGWSLSRIYGWSLPGVDGIFTLWLDYVLESPLSKKNEKFLVAPARLFFDNVKNLKIQLDCGLSDVVDVVSLERFNSRPTPNGELIYMDYRLELRSGLLSWTSTGFKQVLQDAPIWSDRMDLNREADFL